MTGNTIALLPLTTAERAWFQQMQAYADAIAYRQARLAIPCPDCGPQRCDGHACDARLVVSYQQTARRLSASRPQPHRHHPSDPSCPRTPSPAATPPIPPATSAPPAI